MNRKQSIPTSNDLYRAEKQVFAGIFGRLYAKYAQHYEQDYATFLALSVARVLLSMPDGNDRTKLFIKQNQTQIKQEIIDLRDDTEIRRMVTDAMVVRTVVLHKSRGCSQEDDHPLDRIKTLGIYLEGTQPPTPGSFVRTASKFLSASPITPAITEWCC